MAQAGIVSARVHGERMVLVSVFLEAIKVLLYDESRSAFQVR